MKLASFHAAGDERIGFEHEGKVVDLSLAYEALLRSRNLPDAQAIARTIVPRDMTRFIQLGDASLTAAREAQAFLSSTGATGACRGRQMVFEQSQLVWLPPVPRPSKVFCVVVNNPELVEHARRIPDYPIYYSKPTSALLGHKQAIEIREEGVVHPEAELAFVVAKKAKHVSAAAAFDYVYGYSILNDVTAPDVRKRDLLVSRVPMTDPTTGQIGYEEVTFTAIARHKGMDTFGPMGPWLVTKDEVPDPHALSVRAWLGDRIVNDDHTSKLRFKLPRVIEHITRWSTLLPGDVVTLGTASSTKDWPMLDADMSRFGGPVRIEIERLGMLENSVKHA